MEWRKCYLDLILVPFGLMIYIGYHVWLWHKVLTQPLTTTIGRNAHGHRSWVAAVVKNNEKKNIVAVQTLRNTMMGSVLMAATSILLCTALGAVISSKYSVKEPLDDIVYGTHGEFMMAFKYVSLLAIFLFSFICHNLSLRYTNQVSFLINSPLETSKDDVVTAEFVAELMERGFALSAVGNRMFYCGVSLLMWMFGPVMVLVCSVVMVCVLCRLDFVRLASEDGSCGGIVV